MFYPIMLDIEDKKIVVIGGGNVGYRKAKNFLEFEGKVIVISSHFSDKFCELKDKYGKNIILIEDNYKKEYISNGFLVVAATSSEHINRQIAIDCNDEGILCNIVDSLESSEFICPSFINKGDLVLSISTMGKCPFLSKRIRLDLEKKYSNINSEYINLLGEIRNIIISDYSYKKEELLDRCLKLSNEELEDFYKQLKGE
ncbi:precorrin-2 dehydrogenase/sirohydrochlorin ferrochelatase family protein [Anaerosalibacter bizertensis]|uniref:precorrin-2 dehydrogenase/sirohydrochlorin ferrochelatase family protein n=1 Tax=Anaerosalibacter bizertensis TaxID=932217 RepID=UPI0017539BDE|nr:bifunctional precorrin-2 dehydrogenase/sirohydrochlorin ferrochelatase [Anaerosalibacter bizertensis]MBU5293544.1 bifunctional precorrin-2 dehydrogenase/sirohydrochlorin ferrochelatase [Anaerosalibacter bizertensis]HHV26784.1 bifunctional precorrin-2 dehydrogenase/sirohydrochlorin ferrochelatase [Tissierellia bacterium]